MRELCVKIVSGGCRWCHNQTDYEKHLLEGAKPITFLQYLEETKKETEEELQYHLSIEKCAGWYEAVDSAKEWTGFANFDELVSFVKSEETTKYKKDTVNLAIGDLDELITKLQEYKETLEKVSDCLETIQTREEDIQEETEEEK